MSPTDVMLSLRSVLAIDSSTDFLSKCPQDGSKKGSNPGYSNSEPEISSLNFDLFRPVCVWSEIAAQEGECHAGNWLFRSEDPSAVTASARRRGRAVRHHKARTSRGRTDPVPAAGFRQGAIRKRRSEEIPANTQSRDSGAADHREARRH